MTQTSTPPATPGGSPTTGRPAAPGGVDGDRWPDVAVAAGSPLRAAVARALFTRAVIRLPVRVQLPDGRVLGAGPPGAPEMRVHRPLEFFTRLGGGGRGSGGGRRSGGGGLIGFGESYMAGDWDCTDLTGLLTVFAADVGDLVPAWMQRLRRLAVHRLPRADEPTPDGARRNVHRHYDLSNELFALFLDETMTYSSALFTSGADGAPVAAPEVLAAAQRRKIDRLLDRAAVGPGTRLLEIGTGWGELAIRAAARGASVVTVTISPEQHALATSRVAAAGLSSRVSVQLRDYRDVGGEFDAVCSAEMIEAVGEKYWPEFFAVLGRVLAPGGRIGLQAITMPHQRMLATRHTYTWILKYIFPGGLIPSVTAIRDCARRAGLRITTQDSFGAHYAETLRIWRNRFTAGAEQARDLGFDDVFISMWTFYLCYAEAGFRAGYLDVCQLTLEEGR